MGEAAVDAELATLNETQLTLAKEFNKPCEIKNGSVSSIIFGNKESSPVPDAVPVQGKQVTHHRPRERNPGEGEIENLINGDLEALERIDLNKISGKFRVNAESIARELNLDHLVADQ
jgi:hypothetical protein